jgi:hypothetical protein
MHYIFSAPNDHCNRRRRRCLLLFSLHCIRILFYHSNHFCKGAARDGVNTASVVVGGGGGGVGGVTLNVTIG